MAGDWDKPFTMGDSERKKVFKRDGKVNVLFDVEGEELWVPEKCIHPDSDVWCDSKEECGTLVVRLWWAERNGHA
jgi:hypothetical protein